MTGKNLRKATVSLIINARPSDAEEPWPPVVVSGPEEIDLPESSAQGRLLIDLIYDHLRVVGTLVEESDRKIIRVEVFEEGGHALPSPDTGGAPTLK